MNDKSLAVVGQHPTAIAPLTVKEIRAQVNLIQEVMRGVMQSDTHYGVIPGTQKPTLYKAGAEKLLATFRIAVEPEVEDLSDDDMIRYRILLRGISSSGHTVGVGVGECSSGEEKYKWRAAVSAKEFDNTLEDRRRIKYGRNNNETPQVRTEPLDMANTILKMAKKRAQVDLCLTATAASDIFTQDIEDVPDELRENVSDERPKRTTKPPTAKPKASGSGDGKASEAQLKVLHVKLDRGKLTTEEFCHAFGIAELTDLPFEKVNDGLDWIKKNGNA